MKLNLEQITRVKTITKQEFLENYFIPQKPVVIERLIEDWPAYKKWSLDYINEVAGHKEVPLFDDRPISSKYKFNEPHTRMKMSEYVDLLKSKPTNYRIFLYHLLRESPKLQSDYKYPDIGLKLIKAMPYLFFGGQGSKVFMHYDIDLANILHFQFDGEKKVILFPPSETKYLYKVPHAIIAHQEVDFTNPDFKKWPALQKAKGYTTTLRHGETLYMPEGYWHHMTYITPGFSMSIRSLPKSKRNLAQGLFNLFVMRYYDSFIRKIRGEKWIEYKNRQAIIKTNKNS